MKFKRHGTFYIRRGWLPKGMNQVVAEPTLFSNKDINPNDVLGLGSNMVSALRYWLQATGLTAEERKGNNTSQTLTSLGDIIYNNDRFIEEIGTLALLHYKLASATKIVREADKGEIEFEKKILENTWATAWYYLFNEFEMNEFSSKDFCGTFKDSLSRMLNDKEMPADGSIDSDFACILNTYLPNERVIDPEDNKECPLCELGLIQRQGKIKEKDEYGKVRDVFVYRKREAKGIPTKILAAMIADRHPGEQIKIQSLLNEKNSIGKVFNLDSVSLSEYLDKMEKDNLIKITRTAGLDVINFTQKDYVFEDYLRSYYRGIQN